MLNRRIICKICLFIVLFFIINLAFNIRINAENSNSNNNIVKHAKSAILIELDSGEVLYEYNAHLRLEPASMTKIMSIKLVMDAIKSKRITLDQHITTSEYAANMGGTQIYLAPNEVMKVDDLLKSMIIASANDATVSLAEAISGNIDYFVNMMNSEVKELGLKNTSFKNATGLPEENHYSSCYDMAMIARSLLLDHIDVLNYTNTYEDYIRKDTDKPFWLVNTNKMIKNVDGVDGLKTGWTSRAGYCLTCTKSENGMRLISVVMNVDSVKNRTIDTISLLNYGFSNYEKVVIIPKNTVIEEDSNVLFNPSIYKIITTSDIVMVVKKGSKYNAPNIDVKIDSNLINNLSNSYVGILNAYIDDKLIGSSKLVFEDNPSKSSFWDIFISVIKEIF